MSLNWDITGCKLSEETKKEQWKLIEDVIFLTMQVDIGEIKENNLDEFEFRLLCLVKVNETIPDDSTEKLIQFLPSLVGLKTNVITTTRKKFLSKLMTSLEYDISYNMKSRKKDKAVV